MTYDNELYRYCSCRHRLTIHRRPHSDTKDPDPDRKASPLTDPLVCEECGEKKAPLASQGKVER